MAFHYVKGGYGTGTGDLGTTAQTGPWNTALTAAECYPNMGVAIDEAVAGDRIRISDLSTFTGASSGDAIIENIAIETVDDANCENYQKMASPYVERDSAGDFTIGSNVDTHPMMIKGLRIEVDDTYHGRNVIAEDCFFGQNAGDWAQEWWNTSTSTYGSVMHFKSCVFDPPSANPSTYAMFEVNRSGSYILDNCLINSVAVKQDLLFSSQGTGGGTFTANNSNFSKMATGLSLMYCLATGDYGILTLNNCLLPATWSFTDSANTLHKGDIATIYNCSTVAGPKNITGRKDYWAQSLTQSSHYRTGGAVINSVNTAFEIVTNSRCIIGLSGHRFKLCSFPGDFTTSKDITVYFTHDSQGDGGGNDLTKADIVIDVYVPAASGPGTVQYISYDGDYISTAPDCDNTTETWNGTMTTRVQQSLTVTTAGSEGTGMAEIWITVTKPSITVYADPKPSIV